MSNQTCPSSSEQSPPGCRPLARNVQSDNNARQHAVESTSTTCASEWQKQQARQTDRHTHAHHTPRPRSIIM